MMNRTVLALGSLVAALGGGCNTETPPTFIDDNDGFFAPNGDMVTISDMTRPMVMIPDGGDAGELDTTPPSVTIDTPQPGNFIGGVVEVSATIKDAAGVDDGSVFAVFAGDVTYSFPLKRQGQGSTTFTGRYNTRLLAKTVVLPVLSVRAIDKNGNAAEVAEEVVLDVVGPRVSLDPPVLHAVSVSNGYCSHPFDPLGTEAANDGDVVGQLITLRARIEDTGSRASGQRFVLPSLVDPNTVRLYVAPTGLGKRALVIDDDNDGHCDDVASELKPTHDLVAEPGKAVAVQLQPVEGGGNADFSEGPPDNVCNPIGIPGAKNAPPPLCIRNSLTVVKTYWFNFVEPSIYSIPPFPKPPSETCMGLQFDAGNKGLPEGVTLCAAIVAYDKVGNRSVSAPLRLCMEKSPGTKCRGWLPKAGECDTGCMTDLVLNDGTSEPHYARDEKFDVR